MQDEDKTLRSGADILGDDARHAAAFITSITKVTADRPGEPASMMSVNDVVLRFSPEAGATILFPSGLFHTSFRPRTPFLHYKIVFFWRLVFATRLRKPPGAYKM